MVAVRDADPFGNPVPLQGTEQELDGPVDFLPAERAARVRMFRQPAPDVSAKGAVGRYEVAPPILTAVLAPAGAGVGDRGF